MYENIKLYCREQVSPWFVKNNIKIAVVGSGPAGLTCAGELAKKGYTYTQILHHYYTGIKIK